MKNDQPAVQVNKEDIPGNTRKLIACTSFKIDKNGKATYIEHKIDSSKDKPEDYFPEKWLD